MARKELIKEWSQHEVGVTHPENLVSVYLFRECPASLQVVTRRDLITVSYLFKKSLKKPALQKKLYQDINMSEDVYVEPRKALQVSEEEDRRSTVVLEENEEYLDLTVLQKELIKEWSQHEVGVTHPENLVSVYLFHECPASLQRTVQQRRRQAVEIGIEALMGK
ncbi:hypothetical protein E2320_022689 [Naja naja]|nr:hypothetical protein E2320_022689 [Naja naja]